MSWHTRSVMPELAKCSYRVDCVPAWSTGARTLKHERSAIVQGSRTARSRISFSRYELLRRECRAFAFRVRRVSITRHLFAALRVRRGSRPAGARPTRGLGSSWCGALSPGLRHLGIALLDDDAHLG